ncbi:MAG: hypothetical protein WCH43_09165, partial [Verrucomicrobiota bacterium]
SPLDSRLKVTNAAGRQIAFNDDFEDKGTGLQTHGADSRLIFTAPANGLYTLHLGDAQGAGGPEFSYRLRISPPKPDFTLRMVPSCINPRPGATVPVTIYALRTDGFNGDITVALKDAPAGFQLDGGCVPAGQDKVRATLTVPQDPVAAPMSLALEGSASIDGHAVNRPAIPADDRTQAFMYHHLVQAKEFLVVISGTNRGRAPIKEISPSPMKLPTGGTAKSVLTLPGGKSPFIAGETQLQLIDPPDGISIESFAQETGGGAVIFKADGGKIKSGTRGNLIVEAFAEKTPPVAKDGKIPKKNRYSTGILPAIPFEVVDP